MGIDDIKEKINDVSVRLNENRKIHMGLKIDMIWRIYMVKKISEWNLLHDIINPPKLTKILNIH